MLRSLWAVLLVLAAVPTAGACSPAVSVGYRLAAPFVSTVRVQALRAYCTGSTAYPYAGPQLTYSYAPAPQLLGAPAPCPRQAAAIADTYAAPAPLPASTYAAPAAMPYADTYGGAAEAATYAAPAPCVRRRLAVTYGDGLAAGYGTGLAGVDYRLLARRLGFDRYYGSAYVHHQHLARALFGPVHHLARVGVDVGRAVFTPRARGAVVRTRVRF